VIGRLTVAVLAVLSVGLTVPIVTQLPASTAAAMTGAVTPAPMLHNNLVVSALGDNIAGWGYDPAIPPWRPTPAKIVRLINPITAAGELVAAIDEGVNNVFEALGAPPSITIPAPKRADCATPAAGNTSSSASASGGSSSRSSCGGAKGQ
jgi:hypothetical protein